MDKLHTTKIWKVKNQKCEKYLAELGEIVVKCDRRPMQCYVPPKMYKDAYSFGDQLLQLYNNI